MIVWTGRLVAIAALALLVASAVNDWIAGKLFVVPVPPEIDPAPRLDQVGLGRVAASVDAAAVLSNREIFHLNSGSRGSFICVFSGPPALPCETGLDRPPFGKSGIQALVISTGSFWYVVHRTWFESRFAEEQGLGCWRYVPIYVSGEYDGFKLVGLDPHSALRALGLRSGDHIVAVDGEPLDSPLKARDFFDRLARSPEMDVEFVRNHAQTNLRWVFR